MRRKAKARYREVKSEDRLYVNLPGLPRPMGRGGRGSVRLVFRHARYGSVYVVTNLARVAMAVRWVGPKAEAGFTIEGPLYGGRRAWMKEMKELR